MTTVDSNGIVFYETTDPVSPLQTLLNTGQQSVSDAITALGTTWTSWTPSLIGIALGNGDLRAQYQKTGQRFTFGVELVFGSTTTYAGGAGVAIGIALPAGITTVARSQATSAWIIDASTGFDYIATGRIGRSSSIINLASNGGFVASVNDSRPIVWAVNDALIVTGTLQVA